MKSCESFTLTDYEVIWNYDTYHYHIFFNDYNHFLQSTLWGSGKSAQQFEPFLHPELIRSLYEKKYLRAYRYLKALNEPMPPNDAAAACLLALSGTDKLLNTVLDHCPPIPDFQFAGPGVVSSLLVIAAGLDLPRKMRILLQRGANPNRAGASPSPLEMAFQEAHYQVLQELLSSPDLEIKLTEPMLDAWGWLAPTAKMRRGALRSKCCKLLWQHIQPLDSDLSNQDPMPIPPELRPRHALQHNRLTLTAKICETNALDPSDIDDILRYMRCSFAPQYHNPSSPTFARKWGYQTELLFTFLHRFPEKLNDPTIRRLVALAAATDPNPGEDLLSLAAQLSDGPIILDPWCDFYENDLAVLFANWQDRLGDRLFPAVKASDITPSWISTARRCEHLCRIHLIDSIPHEKWSGFLPVILKLTPPHKLHRLFAPGRILSLAPAEKLLALLPQLSNEQCAIILQHCGTTHSPNYDL